MGMLHNCTDTGMSAQEIVNYDNMFPSICMLTPSFEIVLASAATPSSLIPFQCGNSHVWIDDALSFLVLSLSLSVQRLALLLRLQHLLTIVYQLISGI